jgi:hypothetical protein
MCDAATKDLVQTYEANEAERPKAAAAVIDGRDTRDQLVTPFDFPARPFGTDHEAYEWTGQSSDCLCGSSTRRRSFPMARLARTLLMSIGLASSLSCLSCGSKELGPPPMQTQLPPGVAALPGSCTGDAFVRIPSSNYCGGPAQACDFLGCCDPVVTSKPGECGCVDYVRCVGESWSICSCARPAHGTELLPDGAPVDAGSADVGHGE